MERARINWLSARSSTFLDRSRQCNQRSGRISLKCQQCRLMQPKQCRHTGGNAVPQPDPDDFSAGAPAAVPAAENPRLSRQSQNPLKPQTTIPLRPQLEPIPPHERAPTLQTQLRAARSTDATGFDRIEASRRRYRPEPSLPVRCVGQTGPDVIEGEVWKITNNFSRRHSRGQVFQHVTNRDPQPPNASLPAPLVRFNCDEFAIIHSFRLRRRTGWIKARPPAADPRRTARAGSATVA